MSGLTGGKLLAFTMRPHETTTSNAAYSTVFEITGVGLGRLISPDLARIDFQITAGKHSI